MTNRTAFLLLSALAAGCSVAYAKAPAAPSSGVTVVMTAATLDAECGSSGAPYQPPAVEKAPAQKNPAKVSPPATSPGASSEASGDSPAGQASMQMACRQTSMQLSVISAATAPASVLKVTKVEAFDDAGKSIGVLTPRTPMLWSKSAGEYQAWDESVPPGKSLSVSYALSAPDWSKVPDRNGKTYLLKATVTVGGKDQTVKREVRVEVEAPMELPPGAVT